MATCVYETIYYCFYNETNSIQNFLWAYSFA